MSAGVGGTSPAPSVPPPAPHRVQAWLVLLLWPWLLALDWVDDLFRLTGLNSLPFSGDLKSVVRRVGNLLLSVFLFPVHLLHDAAVGAWQTIEQASNLAAQGLSFVGKRIESGLGDLATRAYGWVVTAISYGEKLVSQARQDITNWATDALHFVEEGLSALNRDVVEPLVGFAHGFADWINNVAIPGIVNEAKRLAGDVREGFDKVTGDIEGIADTLAHTVDVWFPVFVKAWSWFVWFALHPFDAFTSAWNDVTHLNGAAVLAGLTDAVNQHGEQLEDWIVQWLGG